MINFSDFSGRFFSAVSAGQSQGDFARTLFDNIVCDDCDQVLESYKPRTYRAYFTGASISRFAQRINMHLEPENFREYINTFPDAVVENLCSQFKDVISDITPFNANEKLSDLLRDIILEAATPTQRGASGAAIDGSTSIGSLDDGKVAATKKAPADEAEASEVVETEVVNETDQADTGDEPPVGTPPTQQANIVIQAEIHDNGIAVGQVFGGLTINR